MKNILAIDIGGSKIVVGIVDTDGNVLSAEKKLLPETYDISYIIECIVSLSAKFKRYNFYVAGVTIPGLADYKSGIWKYAPFSGIADIPICDILSRKLGVPVYAENDVNACAIAEKMYGNCKTEDDFLWMTVSNGIGGALYLNTELYRGLNGGAGEIGHFIVEEKTDALCGCGKKGCLEAMASGKSIEKMYFELTQKKHTAKEIAELARMGNEIALDVYERAGFYIGKAIAYAINLLNIKRVIIGGGVSQSFDIMEKTINDSVKKYVFSSANNEYEIERTALGYYAALIGAASITKLHDAYI